MLKLLAEAVGITSPAALADIVRDEYCVDQLELIHGRYSDMLTWCKKLAQLLWP